MIIIDCFIKIINLCLKGLQALTTTARNNSYSILISIIISIAIFSAELFQKDKTSIEKRAISDYLPIRPTIYFPIGIVILFWIEPYIIEITFLEILINTAIIISYTLTIVLLWKTIKLYSNDLFFMQITEKYIKERTRQIEKEENDKDKEKNISKEDFNKKIKNYNCSIYNFGDFLYNDDYTELTANFSGLVMNINKNSLPKKINIKNADNDPTLYISNVIGKYIKKGETIGYCHKDFEEQYKNTKKFFIINSKYEHYKKLYNEIIEHYFKNAVIGDTYFDNDNSIKDYYSLLLENNYYRGLTSLDEKIETYFYDNIKDQPKLDKYIYFLKSIRKECLKYDQFSNYQKIDNLIYSYNYYFILNKSKEEIPTFRTSMSLILYDLKNKNHKFYDYTVSNYLKLLYNQIKYEKYDIVYELIKDNGTIFNKYETKNSNIFVCNLAFQLGLIKGLNTKNHLSDANQIKSNSIKKIYTYIQNENVSLDGTQILEAYKKIENVSPNIFQAYDNCEFWIDNHPDGEIYTTNIISSEEALIYLLYMNNCYSFTPAKYEKWNYKKEEKFFYANLLDIINANNFDKNTNSNYIKNSELKDFVKYAINKCIENEKEYITKSLINKTLFDDFEKEIKSNILTIKGLLELLNKYSKIEYSSINTNQKLEHKRYIPRKYFIEYTTYKDFLLDRFKDYFTYAIINYYCVYINDHFKTYNTIDEFKSKIHNDKYIIFINEDMYYDHFNNNINTDNTITINSHNIICYYDSNDIVGIKLIPIDILPILQIDSYKCQNTNKINIYTKIYDLSTDEKIRAEIINNSNKKINDESLISNTLLEVNLKISVK